MAVALTASLAAVIAMRVWSSDDNDFRPTVPTTTYIGPAITPSTPEFHLSFQLRHPGKKLHIQEVTALTSPNVEQIGSVTVWPRDLTTGNVGGGAGFPPADVAASHPLEEEISAEETSFVPSNLGFTTPAAVAVSVGFRLTSGDVGAVNGVRVAYEVDGSARTETFREAAIACLAPKNCDGPGGSDDPDFEDRVLRQFALLPKES